MAWDGIKIGHECDTIWFNKNIGHRLSSQPFVQGMSNGNNVKCVDYDERDLKINEERKNCSKYFFWNRICMPVIM